MDFTVLHRQIGNHIAFSPDGAYLALTMRDRLVIRRSNDLSVLGTYTCLYIIQDVQWNPHSDYILTASYKEGKVDVWSLQDEKWHTDIDESYVGLASARWCKDGIHVLTVAEFQLRLTIWSLLTGEIYYIQHPKFKDRGFSYSPDHRFVAVAERQEAKDAVGVYSTNPWCLQKQFTVDTIDMENLAWSPDGRYIVVWDLGVDYKLFVYNPLGILKRSYSAYSDGLGIKTVRWDPQAKFLVVGSFDQKVRLLNTYDWTPFTTFHHRTSLTRPDIKIYEEVDISNEINEPTHQFSTKKLLRRFQLQDQCLQVPSTLPDGNKPHPKLGVGVLDFDQSGQYLCTRNDNMPRCLWIWDMKRLKLHSFIKLLDPVRTIRWNPAYPHLLAFSCTENCVYLWRPDRGCEFYELPAANFQLLSFKWNPNGQSLVFWDKEWFNLGFLNRLAQ
ncbi:hypothetical protein IWQ61_007635 [Dispira simplex]|nr:hypothetical protein IWQ61_007635 [Dispira simplex]